MKKYIIAAAMAIASISAQAQRVTMLIYRGDTVEIKPGRDIRQAIDSINELRFKIALAKEQIRQDSIDEVIENMPDLYYIGNYFDEKGKLKTSKEIERKPDAEFIKAKAPEYDSVLSYSDINYQVFDSINSLRKTMSLNEAEMIYDDDSDLSFTDEAIFKLSSEKKNKALLVKDVWKRCDCSCYQYIVENILCIKRVRKALLNPKNKSFNIAVLQDKTGIYVYVTCIRGIFETTYPVFIPD